MNTLFPKLENYRLSMDFTLISEERKEIFKPIIAYIKVQIAEERPVNLNFICTHNSRRSQISQLWAFAASWYYNINCNSYSGGVEVTAFNERAVAAMTRCGFEISEEVAGDNPIYEVHCGPNSPTTKAFSKLFDDKSNEATPFAALMTCGHADDNCPHIAAAESRLPLRFNDPKAFDDTDLETTKYDERCKEIGTELFYVFSQCV